MSKTAVIVRCNSKLHLRPSAIVVRYATLFHDTEILLQSPPESTPYFCINAKSIMSVIEANIHNGDAIEIEANGPDSAMALDILSIVLETLVCPHVLDDFADYTPEPVHAAIRAKVIARFNDSENLVVQMMLKEQYECSARRPIEYSRNAKLNDRFHSYTAPILPFIVRQYGQAVKILYQMHNKKISSIVMDPDDLNFSIDNILQAQPEAGTEVTVVADNVNASALVDLLVTILKNLRQCDEWLRNRPSGVTEQSTILKFMEFARGLSELKSIVSQDAVSCTMSDLVAEQRVYVFSEDSSFSKSEAIRQIVAPHAAFHALDFDMIVAAVEKEEAEMPIVLRPGLAVSHVTLKRGPRVSFSFGIFKRGIQWAAGEIPVNLVALFVTATDTHGTYRRYMAQMSKLFHYDSSLQERLCLCRNAREAVHLILEVERDTEIVRD